MELATQTHLKTLRDLLNYRLAELRADVRAAGLAARDECAPAGEVVDRKDLARGCQQDVVSSAQAELELDEMRLTERALARLDAGTYGDCIACGEQIPLQRLLAQPAALRCAACQARAEH
jgi:RNA polymerase-binding transcription factor DksA